MVYDSSKPAASSLLNSAEMRGNFAALEKAIGGVNLVGDSTFLIWADGDSSAPTLWTAAGTGVAVARAGTGLGDTSRKVGKFSAKITAGAATATFYQELLDSTNYDDGFDGLIFSGGAFVKCSDLNAVRLYFYDGATTTYSSYHSGGGSFEWLTFAHTVSASATLLRAGLEIGSSKVAYASAVTVLFGEVPPKYPHPSMSAYGTLFFPFVGVQTTGTQKQSFVPARPLLIKDVQLFIKTAPTGAALIVDVNRGTSNSMFSTRPQIAASGTAGVAQPDGTYQYRCIKGVSSGTVNTDSYVTIDIDQVGSTVAGSDLSIQIRALQFMKPLEVFLTY